MDKNQFKQKILPLADRIFPMAKRLLGNNCDAEDLVQEVLLKLWNNRKKLIKHNNITGYVLLTTRNACLDKLKKKQAVTLPEKIENRKLQNTNKIYDENEAVKIVQKIVADMPEQHRTVLQLRDFDGFELNEIAESMQIEITYARVLLSRARKIVREKMVKIYDYEQTGT